MNEREDALPLSIPWYRQVAYLALLFGAALLLVEIGMRVHFTLKKGFPPTPDESLVYEWKWVESRLASDSGDASDDSPFEYDADLGWRLVPDYAREGIRTNARGLRADRSYAPGRSPGRRRIVLLGDSFTFGAHVANDETFAHFIEREELPGWEVPNLAVNGYGTDQALLAYELRGADLAADIVVMGFYVRDYTRNRLRFKVYAKPYFVPDGDGLQLVGHPVSPPETLLEAYANGSRRVGEVGAPYLTLYLAKAWQRFRQRRPAESDPEWLVLSRIMRRFRDHVHSQGAHPMWLVIPYHDVEDVERSRYAAIGEMCEREARALGLSLLNLTGAFREHAARYPDVALYRPREIGGHFSVEGHRLVAKLVASHLRAQGWVEGAH